MPITIQGVRVDGVNISRNEKGKEEVTGDYSLISNQDKVLAKQRFNGYNEVKITFSSETVKALNEFMKGLKNDIINTLGLTE